ncbi:MAG TPA: 2-C-methyl-D-erythritol 4-phosphate cytidylyltransferase [Prolixibacteraceae bacterium]|nr:2-C-methyl-D-erythritol 4-phosphate cytidylyltransferase [Prolixibacteraceae bacterium]
MKKFALIVAGGSGTRMKSDVPKQFIEIAGLPVIMHTINTFEKFEPEFEFILVLPESQISNWHLLCKKHLFNIKHKIAFGGATRFYSVKNGLNLIEDEGIVFIHDAVRPLVSDATIQNCLDCAITKGNALPVISVTDSARIVDGDKNRPADRSQIYLVQTPQTFQTSLIKNAYQITRTDNFTDDATVLESTGATINLVEGNRENIKITTPADLIIAEAFFKMK